MALYRIFYNRNWLDYFKQRTPFESRYLEPNRIMHADCCGRYFDYIGKIIDENETVPIFTPENEFISQDCRHVTSMIAFKRNGVS